MWPVVFIKGGICCHIRATKISLLREKRSVIVINPASLPALKCPNSHEIRKLGAYSFLVRYVREKWLWVTRTNAFNAFNAFKSF